MPSAALEGAQKAVQTSPQQLVRCAAAELAMPRNQKYGKQQEYTYFIKLLYPFYFSCTTVSLLRMDSTSQADGIAHTNCQDVAICTTLERGKAQSIVAQQTNDRDRNE